MSLVVIYRALHLLRRTMQAPLQPGGLLDSSACAELCNNCSGNLNVLKLKWLLQIAMQKKLFEEAKAHAAGQV